MILAIDAGNTNIVIGAIEDGKILGFDRIRTEANATSAEYAIKLLDLLNFMGFKKDGFDGAIISSTVPGIIRVMSAAVENVTGCEAIIVSHKLNYDMEIAIDEPETVGGDLLVGAIAAKECYGAPAIVIDLGTATTMFVIDKNGAFSGGAIMPGVKTSLNALAKGAALLPEVSLSAPEKYISRNTTDCMRSGSVFGSAAMIDEMIDRFEAELGYSCTLVATGGLSKPIVGNCRHEIICDDNLLLKGLWSIYEKNNV